MTNRLGKAKKTRGKSPSTHKHKFYVPTMIDNILEKADIIIQVLDSRFIEKTRNLEIEEKVKKTGKVLIYVLNKSDLVDLNKLRMSTELENIRPNLFFSVKERRGSKDLKKLIKMAAKKLNFDDVNVGIIGYPNIGKSSIINFLTGRASARTSSEAGYTKGIQKIKLSKGLYLIDTPGIIPPEERTSGDTEQQVKHSQIGAVTWDKTKNPDMVVSRLMEEYPEILEKHYEIKAKGDSEFLIEKLGKKMNYFKKGNLIDEERTAKKILKDWQEGKIIII